MGMGLFMTLAEELILSSDEINEVNDHKMVYLQYPSFNTSGRKENLYFEDDIREKCFKYLTDVMNDNMIGKDRHIKFYHYKYTIYGIEEGRFTSILSGKLSPTADGYAINQDIKDCIPSSS